MSDTPVRHHARDLTPNDSSSSGVLGLTCGMAQLSESVALDRIGEVAVITVDNPPVNALSWHVRQGLLDGMTQAVEDDAARLEDVRALAQRERERRALADEQDGDGDRHADRARNEEHPTRGSSRPGEPGRRRPHAPR